MLAPNPDAIATQLTSDYRTNALLMAWSHTLLNTRLYPLTPKPSFFDRIAGELTQAKTETETWLFHDYPRVAAALPQSLLSYGDFALTLIDSLRREVAKPNPDRPKVIGWIDRLQAKARDQRAAVSGLRDKVASFAPKVAAVARRAAAEAQEVSAAASEKNRKVLSLEARIADLNRQLAAVSADAKNAMSGAAATGATLSMTLMSFTVTAAVGTASIPVFGLAGAFIGIGIKAALEASKSREVLNTVREIGQLSLELSAEQSQAAAMRAIVQSLEQLSDQVVGSEEAMAGSLHHWDDICGDLEVLRDLLAAPSLELGRIFHLRPAKLEAAAAAWTRIVASADKVQTSPLRQEAPIEVRVELGTGSAA